MQTWDSTRSQHTPGTLLKSACTLLPDVWNMDFVDGIMAARYDGPSGLERPSPSWPVIGGIVIQPSL